MTKTKTVVGSQCGHTYETSVHDSMMRLCPDCRQERENALHRVNRKDKAGQPVCRHCGQTFTRKQGQGRLLTCPAPECQAKEQERKVLANREAVRKVYHVKPSTSKKTDETKVKRYPCRLCGKMSVNRFYCPTCHHQISNDVADWGAQAMI